jgi:type I restriction enzyme R subunit
LQAIARVNRIFDNKECPKTAGFIVDYSENAQNISSAMALFGNYDKADVRSALIDINAKIVEIRTLRDGVFNEFIGVEKNYHDMLEHLKSDPVRRKFKDKFNKLFAVWDECMNLRDFPGLLGPQEFKDSKEEMKKFADLKKAAEFRYGDKVDFKKYEREIARILNRHVVAGEAEVMTDEIEIFGTEFDAAIDGLGSDRSRAEAIAAQTTRVIRERYETADRAYYKKFSDRIQEILESMYKSKIEDAEALRRLRIVSGDIADRKDDMLPANIVATRGADILWRNMRSALAVSDGKYEELVIGLANCIRENALVDWHRNHETKRQIRERLDDYLYEHKDLVDYGSAENIINEAMRLAVLNHAEFNYRAS